MSCPRAFSGVADVGFDAVDVGFAGESGVFVGVRGLDGSGGSGEGSVVRLIILWILSRVRTLVGVALSCGFWVGLWQACRVKLDIAKAAGGGGADMRFCEKQIFARNGISIGTVLPLMCGFRTPW